ncbi:hypothetical protein HK16_06275 [Acetobacter senegalensis]|uniref:Uncharacterized protein n=2 Tax=Acetobacter TaxID=434 RepID=A0A252EDF9_9PROT|nr:hypothetical protein CIW82_08330 [Acetobacter tropicalis]OUL64449.1 hypothetical protein HK16_06275 [Acetobacter senegalensis]
MDKVPELFLLRSGDMLKRFLHNPADSKRYIFVVASSAASNLNITLGRWCDCHAKCDCDLITIFRISKH